ncbi:tryptophan biosynthesis modulator TrpM [Streptomyces fradiae]|uniref:tryptophan biosynthesis modulator TrpM n=1 Tax=Streptomyces fradiae TaxID=1906 RepID=UPI00368A0B5B
MPESTAPVRPAAARRPRAVLATPPEAYARLARGCRPRGCRAPARQVHGRRVRYVIGSEPGQVNGMRWRPPRGAGSTTA